MATMLQQIKLKKINTIPLESEEQVCCIEYLEALKKKGNKVMYTSIPNSTYTPSWSVKRRNKELGLRAGFPDLVIILNNVLFHVELKRVKGGVLSPEQKEWIQALNEAGEYAHVCKGFGEFKELVDKIINLTKK
jgi:hypothetical protein